MSNHFVVIMAGGRGERFWPESRLARPKQLLPIVGDKPLLAQTVDRLRKLVPVENIFVITNAVQRAAVLETCPELNPERIIGEPQGRDTAAAVGLATILVRQANEALNAGAETDSTATFAVLPADAVIYDVDGFRATLESAFLAAESDEVLATIGIPATHPATGYGYIQRGSKLEQDSENAVFEVRRFVEKPSLEVAQGYLKSGDYFWNAGIFIWSVTAISAELQKHTPGLWTALEGIEHGLQEGRAIDTLLEERYPELEKISIDYAVMEKAVNRVMVESSFDWDDVGEWPALKRHYPSVDENDNVVRGTAHIQDSKGTIVFSRDDSHVIALLGVEDLIVVKTEDATLVCHRNKAQQIKELVKALGEKEALKHLM